MKKEIIVKANNSGKVFGKDILKVFMSNPAPKGCVGITNHKLSLSLSDKEGLNIKKGDLFKITIEKIKKDL